MKTPAERKVKVNIENLSLSFGGVKALDNVSIDIYENEILAIIGPNGAGKTCILNCINGFYKPQSGEIYSKGKKLPVSVPIKQRNSAWRGLSRTSSFIPV